MVSAGVVVGIITLVFVEVGVIIWSDILDLTEMVVDADVVVGASVVVGVGVVVRAGVVVEADVFRALLRRAALLPDHP